MKNTARYAGIITILSLLLVSASPAYADPLGSYRWRADDGTEAAATFSVAENTALGRLNRNTPTRLRFGAGNSGTDSELTKAAAVALNQNEQATPIVVDSVHGYAYFGTNDAQGKIVKVALGTGSSPPTRVANLFLDEDDGGPTSGVIDVVNGYAYFCTPTYPAKIVKISLGDGDAPPTRIGAVTLEASEEYPFGAAIDVDNGYAYFTAGFAPGYIVKIALGDGDAPPTRVGALELSPGVGETDPTSIVIDTDQGYGYIGTYTSPGNVIKIALGDGAALPTRVGALTLEVGENYLGTAAIDTANGYAYYGTFTSPGRIIKVALGDGAALPTRVGALTLEVGENKLTGIVVDLVNAYAYVSTRTDPGKIVKVALGAGANPPTRTDVLTFNAGDTFLMSPAIDLVNGYLYVGTFTWPGMIIKVALGAGANPPTRTVSLELNSQEEALYVAVIDATNGYAYFGTGTYPGKVIKVALGSDSAPPTRIGALTLEDGESMLKSVAIDATNGYAYFGTGTSPGKVVKVALGDGAALPTRIGALTLEAGENLLVSAAIDATNGYAYFGTSTSPGKVVKVALGDGAALPMRIGALTLEAGENLLVKLIIDLPNRYIYIATWTGPCILIKVALGDGAALPTRIGALTLPVGEDHLLGALFDSSNRYIYFGTDEKIPGKIVKVALGEGAALPTYIGSLTLGSGEGDLSGAVIDEVSGYIYFGTSTVSPSLNAGKLFKVSIAPKAQFRLEYAPKVTTCAAVSSWTQVPATATTEPFQMAASSNLTDGQATTNNVGMTDANVSFKAGEVKDTASQTSQMSLGEKEFTELEYSIEATDNAPFNAAYCFRLTNAGTETAFSVANYAEVTIQPRYGTSGGSSGGSISAPSISVRTPATSTTYAPATIVGLEWSGTNAVFTNYKVSFSDNDGASWGVIGETPNASLSWAVPDVKTTNGLIKIEGYDQGGTLLATGTSGSFTVTGAAAVSPIGGTTAGAYDPAAELAASPDINTEKGLKPGNAVPSCRSGSLIRGTTFSAVYYCGADGKRYVFPNKAAFFSWYPDFSTVETISDDRLIDAPLGGNVTYRPGVRMVKIMSDPKVYAVARGGILRWIMTEAAAARLFGEKWNTLIDDIPDSFFVNYMVGESINE